VRERPRETEERRERGREPTERMRLTGREEEKEAGGNYI
jgi:hypothetical protein